ncbi:MULTISPECIES: thioesterase II family protein [unclassified Streptomyces]|uniref:thioesterase II family protein n=1 Tax=unclassified Streptomyces TaxID=2593676 RepID=UPI0035D7D2EB
MGVDPASRWFRFLNRCHDPRLRLVCFPHAGGSASFFRAWAPFIPQDVELLAVRYPGREDRFSEPVVDTMAQLVEPLARDCSQLLGKPLAFFGHSMGASVAYEVALRMERDKGRGPRQLFVSGRSGPGSVVKRRRLADASDAELIADLQSLGGTRASVLDDPELRALTLPAVRADYSLIERYEASRSAVSAPIVAYFGGADAYVGQDGVDAWASVTRSSFARRSFPGGHFYLADHVQELVDDILARLAPPTRRGAGAPGASPNTAAH